MEGSAMAAVHEKADRWMPVGRRMKGPPSTEKTLQEIGTVKGF